METLVVSKNPVKELLIFAAKAADIHGEWREGYGIVILDENGAYCWDPWVDDGCAFRLASKLGLIINSGAFPKYPYNNDIFTATVDSPRYSIPILQEDWSVSENNQMEVIRQLIVKAAANIGKNISHTNQTR